MIYIDKFLTMAEVQASLFIYMAVGYFLRRKKLVSDEMRSGITDLLLNILLPCLVFESFNLSITTKELISASEMLIISFSVCLFSFLLGKFIYYKFPAAKIKILRYGTLIPNSVFAGLPVVKSAYGALGLFYAAVFLIPNRIFMWSAGISLFCEADTKTRLKNIFLNPGIIAVFLGLARLLTKIPLPPFLDTAITNMGDCTTALSMIIVGMMLADVDPRRVFEPGCFYASFVRLVFLPVLLLIALKLFGLDTLRTGAAVIMVGMPFGSTTALLAQRYGADSEFASKCVFVTTALSLITMPLIFIFI